MKRKTKQQFSLEYRFNGRWLPLMKFPTRAAAEEYAKTSATCQREGYQIVKSN